MCLLDNEAGSSGVDMRCKGGRSLGGWTKWTDFAHKILFPCLCESVHLCVHHWSILLFLLLVIILIIVVLTSLTLRVPPSPTPSPRLFWFVFLSRLRLFRVLSDLCIAISVPLGDVEMPGACSLRVILKWY